jgi:heme A synthase
MKTLVTLAAAIEIPTGLVLIFDPGRFMWLLFGVDMPGAGEALGPLAGFALFALAIACWPSRTAIAPAASAVRALLSFSLLCVAYLAYVAVSGVRTGVLLWPAAVGHAVVALLLLWRLLAIRRIKSNNAA